MAHSESVVLDVTDFDQWDECPGVGLPSIPMGRRPSVVQTDRDAAEHEAVRLAQANPGRRFAVFTLSGVVESKEVPTHITLGGKVVLTTRKPVWQERDL